MNTYVCSLARSNTYHTLILAVYVLYMYLHWSVHYEVVRKFTSQNKVHIVYVFAHISM